MNTEWSLDEIYNGFDDEAYETDFEALEAELGRFGAAVKAQDKELFDKVEDGPNKHKGKSRRTSLFLQES